MGKQALSRIERNDGLDAGVRGDTAAEEPMMAPEIEGDGKAAPNDGETLAQVIGNALQQKIVRASRCSRLVAPVGEKRSIEDEVRFGHGPVLSIPD